MTIKKVDGGWLVDEQPGGRGAKRFRKTLRTQAEAKQYQAWLKAKITATPDWAPPAAEKRRLSDLVGEWFKHHGETLRSGEDQRRRLVALCEAMGDPLADKFGAQDFATYRSARLAEGVSAANCNREHAYLKAMFSELRRRESWKKPNPVAGLKMFKVAEAELAYLTGPQIETLLVELVKSSNPHVLLVTKLALSTGGRWGETEGLTISQVRQCRVQFARTKTDKNRTVPISEELQAAVLEHFEKHSKKELLEKLADGKRLEKSTNQKRLFEYCEGAFREGIERAGIDLPRGQMTHVLRHTFASAFMQGGGNILTLQRLLGHKDLKTTMRYAHMSPEHLEAAVSLNPLAQLEEHRKNAVDSSSTVEVEDPKKKGLASLQGLDS